MKTKTELRKFYVDLAASGKLHGSIARAMRLRESRQGNTPLPIPASNRIGKMLTDQIEKRSKPVLVPLGSEQADKWLESAKANNPRLREWSLGARATIQTFQNRRLEVYSIGSNSDWNKRSTFQRGIRVKSTATCTDYRVAVLTLGDAEYRVAAPKGYRWDIDDNGLLIRGKIGSYHPTASELANGPKAVMDAFRGTLARAKAARQEARKTKAKEKQRLAMIERAEKEGCHVCMRDSLKAGNCAAGSESWARRHGLDPKRHYSPSQILSQANGDASRVALVVAVALRRHQAEMERGYAELSDHVV